MSGLNGTVKPSLRVVMVTSDIEGDIEQGFDLSNEPTVILQGPVEAVREAARLFGEPVNVTLAIDAEKIAHLVEAGRAIANGAWRNSDAIRAALPMGALEKLDAALRDMEAGQ